MNEWVERIDLSMGGSLLSPGLPGGLLHSQMGTWLAGLCLCGLGWVGSCDAFFCSLSSSFHPPPGEWKEGMMFFVMN